MDSLLLDFKQVIDTCDFEKCEDDIYVYIMDLIKEEYYKDNIDWEQRLALTHILDDLSITLKDAIFKMIEYIGEEND